MLNQVTKGEMENQENQPRENEEQAPLQREDEKRIWEYATHRKFGDQSCIRMPPIEANNF